MTRKNKNRVFRNAFDFIVDIIKERKIAVIIFSSLMLIAFITGIIVAAKTKGSYVVNDNFGVVNISSNSVSASSFFTRLFSMLLITLLLFGCSFTKWLSPIALLLLIYRSYLLGLYICLMIALYGISGVIISIIVALPCQLFVLVIMTLFYLTMAKTFRENQCYRTYKTTKQKTKLLLIGILLLLCVCVCEEVLLLVFNAKVILVI